MTHSPVTFFSRRIVSQKPPPSLVTLSASAVSDHHRVLAFYAHQRPGAGADVGVVLAFGRDRGDGERGVVAAGCDDLDALRTRVLDHCRQQAAQPVPASMIGGR